MAGLGLLVVFVALFGSSALLSEELKRNALASYLRYLLIALLALVGAPALFQALFGSRRPTEAVKR